MKYSTATPDQIIECFDAVRDYIWGHGRGRDNPHKSDRDTAQRWIDEGLIVPIATIVFFDRMSDMHERWLRTDAKDRTHLPAALKVFDENIQSAILRFKCGEVEMWEGEISRWRSRVNGWKRNSGLWNESTWGPPPSEVGCRAPQEILECLRHEMKTARHP